MVLDPTDPAPVPLPVVGGSEGQWAQLYNDALTLLDQFRQLLLVLPANGQGGAELIAARGDESASTTVQGVLDTLIAQMTSLMLVDRISIAEGGTGWSATFGDHTVYVGTPNPVSSWQPWDLWIDSAGGVHVNTPGASPPAATRPDPPAGVTATAYNTQIVVAWQEPLANGGSVITGYVVKVGASSSPTLAASARSYTWTGLTNGTTYPVTVTAVNAVGSSDPSPTIAATPNAGGTGVVDGVTIPSGYPTPASTGARTAVTPADSQTVRTGLVLFADSGHSYQRVTAGGVVNLTDCVIYGDSARAFDGAGTSAQGTLSYCDLAGPTGGTPERAADTYGLIDHCEISYATDGVDLLPGATIDASCVHTTFIGDVANGDCVTVKGGSGQRITGNTLINVNQSGGTAGTSSPVRLSPDRSAVSNVRVAGNFLAGGKNHVRVGGKASQYGSPTAVIVRANVFHFVGGKPNAANGVLSATGTWVEKPASWDEADFDPTAATNYWVLDNVRSDTSAAITLAQARLATSEW